MFKREDTKTPKLKKLEPSFIAYLTSIKEINSNVIPKELEVGERYILCCSRRCGATTHVRNMGVSKSNIKFYTFFRRTWLNMDRSLNTSKILN